MKEIRSDVCLVALLILGVVACDTAEKPLDAHTRRVIDSTAVVEIRVLRARLDSICMIQHQTLLPKLIDSIRRERELEIQSALRHAPR